MSTEKKKDVEKGSIAFCVPTYNRSLIVQRSLSACAQALFDSGIDVYYYDGSDDTRTGVVVQLFIDQGYTNLHYYHIIDEYPGQRFDMIFHGDLQLKNYEYIWPCKDTSYFTESTLRMVQDCVKDSPDIILTGAGNGIGEEIEYFEDPALFYRDWAWLAASIDVTIWKKSTMAESYLTAKYPAVFGQHYLHLFTRLAELEKVSIQVIRETESSVRGIGNVESSWEKNVFKIWKEDWIEANELLPSCYDPYKPTTVKAAASLPWILGGTERLNRLKEKGILTPERLDEVRPNWERVSDIPFSTVEDIAYGRYVPEDTIGQKALGLIDGISKMILKGDIDAKQVPFESMENMVLQVIGMQRRYNEETMGLIRESIDSLAKISNNHAPEKEYLAGIVEIIRLYLLMAG